MFRFPFSEKRLETRRIWRKYLEMTEQPAFSKTEKARLPDGLVARRVIAPTLEFYRFLYFSTGRDLQWVDRVLMPDEELLPEIHSKKVEIWTFFERGQPIGYFELDFRKKGEVELKYFGLMPPFRARGWGKKLFAWVFEKAWRRPSVQRMHFQTCEHDDPRALPIYLSFGFRVFEKTTEDQAVLV